MVLKGVAKSHIPSEKSISTALTIALLSFVNASTRERLNILKQIERICEYASLGKSIKEE